MPYTKNRSEARCSTVSDKKSLTGRDRLNWRKDGVRLLLFRGTDKNPLAVVEPDGKYPFLYRIRYPDGHLSDMVNLTRAKDAAFSSAGAHRMRSRLEMLLSALDASLTALGPDDCGDWAIFGKLGHIYIDGQGFLLHVTTGESARRWFNVKQRLNFCRLTQDGDDEGCLHLDHLPTKIEASAIREALGIRKRRHLSPASRAQAISALGLNQSSANSPSGDPTFVKKHSG